MRAIVGFLRADGLSFGEFFQVEQTHWGVEAEFSELTKIGNAFQIRHFEHEQSPLPTPTETVVDYLFTRLAALIAYLLRQTGRM